MKKIAIALIVCITALPFQVTAQNTSSLEAGLSNALQLKKGQSERNPEDSGAAIRAYGKEGYVSKKPNQRADYTDYYLLKKPATFMGHTLVLIEEEYMLRHIGCCVSPGVGITVRASGSTAKLDAFAGKNKCSVTDDVDFQAELKSLGIAAAAPKGKYVRLSCRERDANRD